MNPQIFPASGVKHITLAKLRDIVFVQRSDSGVAWSFNLGYINTSTGLSFDEMFFPDNDNLEEGTGIIRITGEILCSPNSVEAVQQIQRNIGQLLNAHFFYTNNTVISFPAVLPNGSMPGYVNPWTHIKERYPLIENFKDRFGIKIRHGRTSGGENRRIKLILTGVASHVRTSIVTGHKDFLSKYMINSNAIDPSIGQGS